MMLSKKYLLLSVFLLLLLSAGFSQDFSTLPPFDTTRIYQVPGAQLEELRLAWIASKVAQARLETDLTLLAASFEIYKTEAGNRLHRLQVDKDFFSITTAAGFSLALGCFIADFLIP